MSTIFAGPGRAQIVPQTYSPRKRLICFLHLEIAHAISALHGVLPEERQALLDLLDEAFDQGKRMNRKLAEYRKDRETQTELL